MSYSTILIFHIVTATIGLVAGAIALFSKKGTTLHKNSGKFFAAGMVMIGTAGATLAYMINRPETLITGIMMIYLVGTATAAIKRKENETGLFEISALALAISTAIAASYFGYAASNGEIQLTGRTPAGFYYFQATLLAFFSTLDIRVIIRGGVSGAQRIVRHVWRMCLALLIAVTAIFLGNTHIFSDVIRNSNILFAPSLIVIVLMIYWMIRVTFTDRYRSAPTNETVGETNTETNNTLTIEAT